MQAKIAELRNRLSYYLRRVAGGEVIEVLQRERPVARIVPISAGGQGKDPWVTRLRKTGLAEGGPLDGVKEILREPPPGSRPAGVVDALLQERDEGR